MGDTYYTLKLPAEGIYKEKMSKFLAFAHPVYTVEEAKALYDRCPRLLNEKAKAILIKSGLEEIVGESNA